MRRICAILTAFLVAASFAWAGGNAEEPSGGGGESEEMVTLTIAGRDGAYGDGMDLAAEAFMAENPNVEIEVLKLSGSALFEQTVVDLRSGTSSYDIILIDDPNAPQYMAAGWLADLDEMFQARGIEPDEDFIDPTLMLGRYPYAEDGTLYALPHVGNVELFAYRRDLFEKHGLASPETWDAVMTAAEALAENEPGVSPILFRGSKGNPIVTGFLPILWSFGANVLEDGEASLDSPEAVAAVEYFLELSQYAPEGVANYQSAQVRDALYSGTGAIAIEVWPGWIRDINNPDESAVVDQVAITKHPRQTRSSSPMIGVWLAAIPENAPNSEVAFDFLLHLTSEEMQRQMSLEAGIPPTRASVHEMADVQEAYFWYPAQLDGLQNGVARPRTDQWKEVEAALGEALQQALIGEIGAEEAVRRAHERIAEIVG